MSNDVTNEQGVKCSRWNVDELNEAFHNGELEYCKMDNGSR